MDKKYTFIGLLLMLTAIVLFMQELRNQAEERERALEEAARQAQEAQAQPPAPTRSPQDGSPMVSNGGAVVDATANDLFSTLEETPANLQERPEEQTYVLENDFIRVTFSSWGGAIKTVAFKKYTRTIDSQEPYVFNQYHKLPALALSRALPDGTEEEFAPPYQMSRRTDNSIEFRRLEGNAVEFVRTYTIDTDTIDGPIPYTIAHSTRLINRTEETLLVNQLGNNALYFNLGTAAPELADPNGWNMSASWFDGDDFDSEHVSGSRGFFFGIGSSSPRYDVIIDESVQWAAVKNQFFAGILTPSETADGVLTGAVNFPEDAFPGVLPYGTSSSLRMQIPPIASNAQVELTMDYYIGPKEYHRLSLLDQEQDRVMEFGFFGFFSKLLLTLLIWMEGIVQNWGLAIVCVTILIRLLFWPLLAKSAESSYKMSKLQPLMKEVREKYKDNPRKMQEQIMKLYKEQKINPLAGCLPLLIQIPILFAFFFMLRSASELRFAEFLWIADLSRPDTIFEIAGFPVNIMPILYTVSMIFLMFLTPMPTGGDPMQEQVAKMMRWLPLVFVFILYDYASGLFVYWTTSNLISILQQKRVRQKRERMEAADAAAETANGNKAPPGETAVKELKDVTAKKSVTHTGRAKAKKKKNKP